MFFGHHYTVLNGNLFDLVCKAADLKMHDREMQDCDHSDERRLARIYFIKAIRKALEPQNA
jgi:hypothetical protein